MLFYFRHFIYKAMKHIVEQHGTSRFRLLHNTEVILYLYGLIRLLIIGLMFFDSKTFPLYEYDYGSKYFWNHRKILNKFFLIILILIFIAGLHGIKTFFYTHVDTLSFQMQYDCIVYNTDQYYKSRDTDENIAMKLSQRFEDYQQQFVRNHRLLSKIIPRFLVNHLFRIRVWIDSWLQLDRVDRNLFENQNKMRLFPNANIKSRKHVLLFVLIIDCFNFIGHIFVAISVLIGMFFIVPELATTDIVRNSLIMKFYLFIESIIFLVDALLLFQCIMLLFCSVSAPFQVFHNTLKHLNQKFYAISENSRIGKPIGANELKELQFIYRQHNILCYYEIFTDKDVWSQALYYYALVSIPINVTFMCELILEDLPKKTRFLFLGLTALHVLAALAHVTSAFHKIKDYIPAVQVQLNRLTHLRMKLKYDDLYERLTHGKKIAYTFGYLGDLTYRGLFEAFLGYIAAFFLIIRFYMNGNQTS
ncbi:hypothetical protein HUG17_0871 [Dermatophagoides farinae]|uniref:Uncharacterized protein n=1 Tax=Dermatophagoides farinae TaxID=6954 RepID=A0A9D4P725_DERFA|nr:hypothetical protein HUG17_0871 [Dermatophagoides farinae]